MNYNYSYHTPGQLKVRAGILLQTRPSCQLRDVRRQMVIDRFTEGCFVLVIWHLWKNVEKEQTLFYIIRPGFFFLQQLNVKQASL